MRPPRAPTASSCWRGAGAPSPLDPRSRGWRTRRRLSLPIPGRNRLLEIEHISVRVDELAEPLAPFHLLGRQGERDAHLAHPLVVRKDVVREERDTGRTRFRLVHLAEVHAGPRTERAHLDPVTRVLRRPLNGRVHVRNAWSDVRDVESEDVPIPSNRLVSIRDDNRDRVDAEDSHILPKGRNGIPRYELARDLRRNHLSAVPRPYILAYHSMTSWSEMRSTCSSTASSFSDSHKSTIRRAAGSPWNSVTMSCHFRRRALNAATISGPSKTT